MDEYKIILFCCNWCPHAAYLNLQDRRADIPDEIRMVRIPCSGRITKALLFKAFEMGADGVILLGALQVRAGMGADFIGLKNANETREILACSDLVKEGSGLKIFC
jgi:coenzyme F420-reducing hydrogenase delta subunit